ncbi:MAG: hypothetical protein ACTSU5_01370 [Promethearchaeota archaeon]
MDPSDVFDFLEGVEFSSWYAFNLPATCTDEVGERAIRLNERLVPRAADGFTIGNDQVFASVGCPFVFPENIYALYQEKANFREELSPTRLGLLVGPERTGVHLKTLFNELKFQDYSVEYSRHARGEKGARVLQFSEFHEQRLRRVRKTSILSAGLVDEDLAVTTVDFVPLEPDWAANLPVLFRLVVLENITPEPLGRVRLHVNFFNWAENWTFRVGAGGALEVSPPGGARTMSTHASGGAGGVRVLAGGDPEEFWKGRGHPSRTRGIGERASGEGVGAISLEVTVGDLGGFQRASIVLRVVVGDSVARAREVLDAVLRVDPLTALKSTRAAWESWSDSVKFTSDDVALADFVDGVWCMQKCQSSHRGFGTGSIYYGVDTAFTRDNYWNQRALLELGRPGEARRNLEFFARAWRESGTCNSYHINTLKGHVGSTNPHVEVPAYLALMVESLARWTGDAAVVRDNLDFVEGVLGGLRFTREFTTPLNSDETWIWPVFVNEIDDMLDNAVIAVVALEFGATATRDAGRGELARAFGERARKLRETTDGLFLHRGLGRYAVSRDPDGLLDTTLMPTIASRLVLLGYRPPTDPAVRSGLLACLHLARGGVVRSHSATTAIAGNTPGYFLWALSEVVKAEADGILAGILGNFLDCTGMAYEIHDLYDPGWGTEKRRVWDTSVLAMGAFHHLFGIEPDGNAVIIEPHLPNGTNEVSLRDFPVVGHLLSVHLERPEAGPPTCKVSLRRPGGDGSGVVFDGLGFELPCRVRLSPVEGRWERFQAPEAGSSREYEDPYSPIAGSLDSSFVESGRVRCAVVHDAGCGAHAREVTTHLLRVKNRFFPTWERSDFVPGSWPGNLVWVSRRRDFPLGGDGEVFRSPAPVEGARPFEVHEGVTPGSRASGRAVRVFWVPVGDPPHAYRDTHEFCQVLGTYCTPARPVAISMFPYGHMLLCDRFGSPVDDVVRVEVEIAPESGGVPPEFAFHVQGEEITPAVEAGASGPVLAFDLDLARRNRPFKPTGNYVSIHSITPYVAMDAGAAGIATGENACHLVVRADATGAHEVTVRVHLPQWFHPIRTREGQHDRLVDRIRLHKRPDGSKLLELHLHVGTPVEAPFRQPRTPPSARSVFLHLGKY